MGQASKKFVLALLGVAVFLIFSSVLVMAQNTTAPGKEKWARDFNGEWSSTGVGGGNTLLLPGEEVSLTKFGAEQYNKIDDANSPAYKCEPYGPTRIMVSALPFRIFQQEGVIGIIFEHIDYRLIYMNAKHPDDIVDYPEWEGNSVGRWEGDTLVVDTTGMREESWLDSYGLQHSVNMHMVERFTKTSPDTFVMKVTIEDPTYYTKPFTYANNFERDEYRIVPDRCEDTSPDEKYSKSFGKAGPTHTPPPTFPPDVKRTYIGVEKEGKEGASPFGRGFGAAKPVVQKTKFEEDSVKTSKGDLKITSIANYSLMFNYNGKVIYVDPVGRFADYSSLPKADAILVTHVGADHIDPVVVKSLSTDKTSVEVCPHCWMYLENGDIMINGENRTVAGVKVEAVPAYNIKGQLGNGKPNTGKASANGYVLTFGDKRVYVAGETENVPEVKAQKQIDIAFLPVNAVGADGTPAGGGVGLKTMTPKMFADAVKAIQPKVVFPYAYGNNDPKSLMALLKDDQGVDVRVRDMK